MTSTEYPSRFIKCTVPKCNRVIQKDSLEEHLKNMHVDVFCELCGKAFSNKKTYQSHYTNRHYRTTCKVCKVELFQYQGCFFAVSWLSRQ